MEQLAQKVVTRNLNKEEMLFQKGDLADGLYGVLQGVLRLEVGAPDGRERVFNTIGEGEVFGEIALIDGKERTATAIADTQLVLAFLPRADFLELLQIEPEMSLDVMVAMCSLLRRLSSASEDTAFLNIGGRLARRLLQLSASSGPVIRTSQEKLARQIGASRVSVNQRLQRWKSQGIVNIYRGSVEVLDASALELVIETSLDGSHRFV